MTYGDMKTPMMPYIGSLCTRSEKGDEKKHFASVLTGPNCRRGEVRNGDFKNA